MITNKEQSVLEVELNHLVIISGATRGIGRAFACYYRSRQNTTVIGIGRSKKAELTQLDLLDEPEVNHFVDQLDLSSFRDIVYVHAVGIDKFEPDGKPHIDRDCDGIDDEVYATNVTAFSNLADPLIEKARQIKKPMTIVNIGSISDIYRVPYWQSFSRSKNKVRKYLKSITDPDIKGITLNVGSTLDENNNRFGRVNADVSYWQTAQELVTKSIGSIEGMRHLDSTYAEIDFCKYNPNFKSDYFTNLPKLFANWQRDMGFLGKEVPHGIRI
jgi:NADP-dependent 3-hydroxy acid dehydrogenase YdfG